MLAKAGLDRLGADVSGLRVRLFDEDEIIPAGCQGILALQCREDDPQMRDLLGRLSDPVSRKRFEIERELFCLLKASCTLPLGVHAALNGEKLTLRAIYDTQRAQESGDVSKSKELCRRLAERLL